MSDPLSIVMLGIGIVSSRFIYHTINDVYAGIPAVLRFSYRAPCYIADVSMERIYVITLKMRYNRGNLQFYSDFYVKISSSLHR